MNPLGWLKVVKLKGDCCTKHIAAEALGLLRYGVLMNTADDTGRMRYMETVHSRN